MSLFVILQTALGAPGLIGLIALVSFVTVYVIRKKFGPQWERVAAIIPALNFDLTPGWVIVSKFVQALPSVIVAAAFGAITSGASLGPTLLAALAGLLAPLGHELAKAVPFIPYNGNVGEAKLPGAPKLPTGLGVLMLSMSLFSCSALVTKEPCTAADKTQIESTYSAEFMEKCLGFNTASECPFTEEIRAKRAKSEEKCR